MWKVRIHTIQASAVCVFETKGRDKMPDSTWYPNVFDPGIYMICGQSRASTHPASLHCFRNSPWTPNFPQRKCTQNRSDTDFALKRNAFSAVGCAIDSIQHKHCAMWLWLRSCVDHSTVLLKDGGIHAPAISARTNETSPLISTLHVPCWALAPSPQDVGWVASLWVWPLGRWVSWHVLQLTDGWSTAPSVGGGSHVRLGSCINYLDSSYLWSSYLLLTTLHSHKVRSKKEMCMF